VDPASPMWGTIHLKVVSSGYAKRIKNNTLRGRDLTERHVRGP
jgi:hypothetical protein